MDCIGVDDPAAPTRDSLGAFLTGDLSWLNFHRFIFLVAFAFYFLGLLLALNFLWKSILRPIFKPIKKGILDHQLGELDRMHHHMILWALPLLSVGIFTKILMLIDSSQGMLVDEIWQTAGQEFLAIALWFICALYLHARIFLKWQYNACAFVYLGGAIVVLGAHFSGRFMLQIT